MIDAGIFEDDIIIVDRSLEAPDNDVVIAAVNGAFTIKTLRTDPLRLVPENPNYPEIQITENTDFELFGVVTFTIHILR